ncbi:MAG: SPOR domain-containing protein [Rikenellaceae bacterium]
MQRLLIPLFVSLCTLLHAESLQSYRDKLQRDQISSYGEITSVSIEEDADAQSALRRIESLPKRESFLGYRIGIFFDNGADARAKANEAQATFDEAFPAVPSFLVYENPYFKLSAGNCATQEEAVMLLKRVQSVFPKAFVTREEITPHDVVFVPKHSPREVPSVDSL